MKGFADLADLPEDERITVIRRAAQSSVVAFFVETHAKANRYLRKLGPSVREIERGAGPMKGMVYVKVGPKGH